MKLEEEDNKSKEEILSGLKSMVTEGVVQCFELQKISAKQALVENEGFKDRQAILEHDCKKLEKST